LRAAAKCNAVETRSRLFFIAQIEICIEIDLKRAKPAVGLYLRAEITETKLFADSRFVRHKYDSEKAEI